MPCHTYSTPWDSDPRRWEACRKSAAAQMLSEGWNRHAKKFGEVQRKRALRLWNNS